MRVPIVEREEHKAWGRYRSRKLCLAWINAIDQLREPAQRITDRIETLMTAVQDR